jgi:hypothetical protein
MSAMTLIIILLVAIGSAVAAVLITVAVSSLAQAHRVRVEPTLDELRRAIVAALSGEGPKTVDALAGLNRMSERYVVNVMMDLAPSVNGTSRSILISLAEDVGLLGFARAGVGSRRWSKRLYCARVLTAFGVPSATQPALLVDRSPEVRAQAAAWCVATPGSWDIQGLVAMLEDEDGRCRFAAQDALIRIGLPASVALLHVLEGADVAAIRHVLQVAAAMGDGRFFPPAHALLGDLSPVTRALAAAVVARAGDPDAGPALVALLDDRSDQVVLAATVGLAQLGYWPGAVAVELLLSHPTWAVRKQAGLTLLALGAPGVVLLRASAPGVGPAAEMAEQALQVRSLSQEAEAA